MIWRNDELYGTFTDSYIEVGVMEKNNDEYIVLYSEHTVDPDRGGSSRTLKDGFTNKKKARKYAVAWMRNHPAGLKS